MNKITNLILTVIVAVILNACANIVAPTGGPEDFNPPVVEMTEPENYSTNFSSDVITLSFDEFVQIKGITSELIISPPLDEKPEVKLKGKEIEIQINNELKENTTYTFNFGNGISDVNKNNVLKNFKYVFSTGNVIDSLTVKGKIIDAFTLENEKEMYVMLYDSIVDSVPLLKRPNYLGVVSNNGEFEINNVKEGKYKIFALNDQNNNLLFDQPNERIAYIDTVIEPYVLIEEHTDTISEDSIITHSFASYYPNDISLRSFEEDAKKQYIVSNTRDENRKLTFFFNRSTEDTLIVEPLSFEGYENWKFDEINPTFDTITYWINDSVVYNIDTLLFNVSYYIKDSLGEKLLTNDTVKFVEKKSIFKKGKSKPVTTDTLIVSGAIFKSKKLDLNKNIKLRGNHPIANVDTSLIELYKFDGLDTTTVEFTIISNDNKLREKCISYEVESSMKYHLKLYPKAITDIYGFENDTLQVDFSSQNEEYYGKILLAMSNITNPLIVQLLGKKKEIIKEVNIKEDGIITFDYIAPQEYSIRVIIDENDNKKWDTGKYLKNIQPEKVKHYKEIVKVRSNWDVELNWDIKSN